MEYNDATPPPHYCLIDFITEMEEACETPPFGERLWSMLVDEIARLRALNEVDSRICPYCLHEVDVRLTMCPQCMAIFIAVGKVDRVVPAQREPSPQSTRDESPSVPTAQPSNIAANIQEVINQARESAEKATEDVDMEEGEEEGGRRRSPQGAAGHLR